MTAVWYWAALDLRRRWRAVVVLSLLTAVTTAAVLTAVAGARRTVTAVDRLWAASTPADVAITQNRSDFDWDVVRALPEVRDLAVVAPTGFAIEGIPDSRLVAPYAYDGAALYSVERPVVISGRLPDPSRVDEAVVTPQFLLSFGRRVGDRLAARLYRPEAIDQAFHTTNVPEPDGPRVPMTIVGVIRSPWFSDATAERGIVVPSPALFAQYRLNLLGHEVFPTSALARLRDGESGIPGLQAALAQATGRRDFDITDLAATAHRPQSTAGFEAGCLLALGAAALGAALVIVGQSIGRQVWTAADDLQVLGTLGMTPLQRVSAGAAAPSLAGVVGAATGSGLALLASSWLPFGSTALIEPRPGVDLDWLVLGGGGLAAAAMVATIAGGVAWLLAAAPPWQPLGALTWGMTHTTAPRSRMATALRGLPVSIVTGIRFAVEPGRRRTVVPVRAALLGAVTAVLGVLAAASFAAGATDAADHPERFGQSHQLYFNAGYNDEDFLPVNRVLQALVADPDVAGANDATVSIVESAGTKISAFTFDPVGTAIPAAVLEGRLPTRADELALAPTTAQGLGLRVDDTVAVTGTKASATYRVSGIALVPAGWANTYDSGAWWTPAGRDAVTDNYSFHFAMVALRPGVSPVSVLNRLGSLAGAAAGVPPVPLIVTTPVPEMSELNQIRVLPRLLGAFLLLIGVGAVAHALSSTVGQRRTEVAVLRVWGMTRWQLTAVFATQAGVVTAIGLLFGLPIGAAVGRTLWRVVAGAIPLEYRAPQLGWSVALIAGGAIALALVLAAWPARRAVRLRIASALRAE